MDQVLALAREAGTPEAETARGLVRDHLAALGYRVTLQRFRFHPSGLLALPLLGAGLGVSALLAFPLLMLPGVAGWGALAVTTAGLGASAVLSAGVALGWLPLGPTREDANILAVRSERPVRRWIVAHLDTKAQAHSMAGRLVAVWCLIIALTILLGSALLRLLGPLSLPGAMAAVLPTLGAGLLAARGRLQGRSRGARDNGSGVFAALACAERSTDPAAGILITGAEEFGLVGARVFAELEQDRLRDAEVVNLDTLDQQGDLYLVRHDHRGAALAAALLPGLSAVGLPVRSRRLPLGILVDSLPMARAGARAVTIGRLNWGTLRVIHTGADEPAGLSFDTAERVGRALGSN